MILKVVTVGSGFQASGPDDERSETIVCAKVTTSRASTHFLRCLARKMHFSAVRVVIIPTARIFLFYGSFI